MTLSNFLVIFLAGMLIGMSIIIGILNWVQP